MGDLSGELPALVRGSAIDSHFPPSLSNRTKDVQMHHSSYNRFKRHSYPWAHLAVAAAAVAFSHASFFHAEARAQHAHDGDIEVSAEDNRLLLSRNFVEAEFASENPGTLPWQIDDPGFIAEKEPPAFESPLADGTLFGFDVGTIEFDGTTRSLWFWDGGDGVTPPTSADFVGAPHELKISHPVSAQSIQIDGAAPAAGFFFGVANVDPNDVEVMHAHLLFTLVDAAGAGVLSPLPGLYLFKTTHHATDGASPLDGNPDLYWIAALGVDEAMHELAVDFVVDHFALAVPEPSATWLGGLAVVSAPVLWRRRGRRRATGRSSQSPSKDRR